MRTTNTFAAFLTFTNRGFHAATWGDVGLFCEPGQRCNWIAKAAVAASAAIRSGLAMAFRASTFVCLGVLLDKLNYPLMYRLRNRLCPFSLVSQAPTG